MIFATKTVDLPKKIVKVIVGASVIYIIWLILPPDQKIELGNCFEILLVETGKSLWLITKGGCMYALEKCGEGLKLFIKSQLKSIMLWIMS